MPKTVDVDHSRHTVVCFIFQVGDLKTHDGILLVERIKVHMENFHKSDTLKIPGLLFHIHYNIKNIYI